MEHNNRINRLSSTLVLLSKGQELSTPSLVERFGVTKKIIQTDFKEYILPLFNDGKIFYDYSSKTYKAKNNFLSKTLFNADELAVIAILKNKSKDKYSDEDLSIKVDVLFDKFEDELSNILYQKSSVEKIDNFKDEIIQIKNAIESRSIIQCTYNKKDREVYPLKILNLEGYWYLIVFEPQDKKIKTFHLNTIKKIEVLNKCLSNLAIKEYVKKYNRLEEERIELQKEKEFIECKLQIAKQIFLSAQKQLEEHIKKIFGGITISHIYEKIEPHKRFRRLQYQIEFSDEGKPELYVKVLNDEEDGVVSTF